MKDLEKSSRTDQTKDKMFNLTNQQDCIDFRNLNKCYNSHHDVMTTNELVLQDTQHLFEQRTLPELGEIDLCINPIVPNSGEIKMNVMFASTTAADMMRLFNCEVEDQPMFVFPDMFRNILQNEGIIGLTQHENDFMMIMCNFKLWGAHRL